MQREPSTSVVLFDPVFADGERVALAGFLAGYRGAIRDAYALDLRQFVAWWADHHLGLFMVRRSDMECYARTLEQRGRARAAVARRLCSVTGFYRYAEEEGLVALSPAVHVRRPRLDDESHAVGLDRNELGALLLAAGLGPALEYALISVLALIGLRVSEATGANIEALGLERGHRTLTVLRKGGKIVTIPLAPRTARAIDLAIGERAEGPIFVGCDRARLDRHGAARIVRRVSRRAGITKPIGPHTSPRLHSAALDAGVPLPESKRPPRTPIPGPRCAMTGQESASTDTPPTSSQPSSPAPAGREPD
jgi:site-specific recombinase XerD